MQKLQNTEKILIILSHGCATLERLEEKTGIPKKELLVYLTRLHKRGLIYRTWQKYGGKKFREYCLKGKDEMF
ncbi:DNA-binding protein [Stygiolobus caldivivus]|uniref:DNA-binding protein n=1 Tax=Stygiolobus caldivivus TaxID=2824673 RepID=UPI001C8484D6|nr:DNA-binding protein [Stygiolobus caldivivus]